MGGSTPKYIQPPPDPALQILQQQTADQKMQAVTAEVASANARHALLYGTRMALPTGTLPLSGLSLAGGQSLFQPFGGITAKAAA